MAQRIRTAFSHRGLTLHGRADDAPRELDLFSGAMHYWRHERSTWRQCLMSMRELGLAIVETYVPWGEHELDEGRYDWSDESDLGAFLDLAAELDMVAIVRPGPHINAELTFFGYPERIIADSNIQARSSAGTPVWLPAPPRMFPVPSQAAAPFVQATQRWYAAVAEVVRPRLWPSGPVVALQVDNEAQLFFRLGAFDHDYHPDALVWWRELAGDLEPPRAWDPADAERCLRWVQFKEHYVQRSLRWMSEALDDVGLTGVARFHNVPPAEPTLVNLPGTARAVGGVAGMDFYHRGRDYAAVRRRGLYLTGSATPLPFAPEVGLGGPFWLLPMTEEDQQNVILGLLATGVRGLNFYMTVDRDRWYGAPIAADGSRRPSAAWLEALLTLLDRVQWTQLRRRTPIALLVMRADARVAIASSLADPLSPVVGELLDFGSAGAAALSRDVDARTQRRWAHGLERALELAQVPYQLVDEEVDLEVLAGYRAVVAPTVSRIDRALLARLRQLPERGVVVVLGPGRPTRDAFDQPLGDDAALPARAGLLRAGSLEDLDGLADDLLAVAGSVGHDWTAQPAEAVEVSVFETQAGQPRVVFVGNRSNTAVRAELRAATAVRDPFGPALQATGEVVVVELAPHQVRLLLCDDAAASPVDT